MVDEGYLEGDVQVSANVEITAEHISKKYIVSELKDILREMYGTFKLLHKKILTLHQFKHMLKLYSLTKKILRYNYNKV